MLKESKRSRWRRITGLLLTILLLAGGCTEEETTIATSKPSTPTPTHTAAPTSTPTATVVATSTPRPTATPTPTRPPTALTPSMKQLAAEYPEIAAILNNPEIRGAYKQLLVAYQQGGEQAALNYARQQGLVSGDGQILATLVLDTEDTAGTVAQLQTMGVTVLGTSGNRISIAISPELIMAGASQPGAFLNQLANIEHVTGVLPPS